MQQIFFVLKKSTKITTDGQQHLGAVIESTEYKRIYIQEKMS